jgi:hypothetical protein
VDTIVLSSNRNDQTQPDFSRCQSANIASSAKPASCRGPPQLAGHRSRAAATTPAKLSDGGARQVTAVGALPTTDEVDGASQGI